MRTARIQIKATGQWFWYYAKESFGVIYFSFDEENWFVTKTKAYRDAEARGSLQSAQPSDHPGSGKSALTS